MCPRVVSVLVVALIFGVCTYGCQRTDAPQPAGTNAVKREDYEALKSRVETLASQVEKLPSQVEELVSRVKDVDSALSELVSRFESQTRQDIATLRTAINDLEKQNQHFELKVNGGITPNIDKLREATDFLRKNYDELHKIVQQISNKDLNTGRSLPAILSNMENSPTFRAEMGAVVREALRDQTTGTLIIENNMTSRQTLAVNGEWHQLAPGEVRRVTVRVGIVTTELVNYEAPKNIYIGPPNYEQRLVIAPAWKPVAPAPAPLGPVVVGPAWYVVR